MNTSAHVHVSAGRRCAALHPVMVVLAISVAGCSSSGDPQPTAATASASPAAGAAADSTQAQAGDRQPADPSDYTYDKKEEFMNMMKAQLDKINNDIDALSTKIDKASDASKADATARLQELRDRASKLGDLIRKGQDATADTWEKFKGEVSSGCGDLQKGIADARQWLSDKIAP